LDYLLFGTGKNVTSILSKYTSDSKASNRKQYLAAVSAVIKTDVNKVVTAWLPTGGNYIQTFINASGTDAGSSVGQLINSLDYDFEILKNDKIAIPAGIQSMGTLFPTKVEGYYSGISSQLAVLQLKTLQSIYLGNGTAPSDTLGFDDYLTQIGAQYNGGSLNTAIKAQFTSAITALAALPDPFSATVQSNTSGVTAAYGELQKLLVLLKTDMPSAMGVLITYDDNDGD
jgi:predicted lipoprotein